MRPDLDRAVAGVHDHQSQALIAGAVGVQLDGARSDADCSGGGGGGWCVRPLLFLAKSTVVGHRICLQMIGLWIVTSLRPSGKVASTWTSVRSSATPGITWSRARTVRPDSINSATRAPSR